MRCIFAVAALLIICAGYVPGNVWIVSVRANTIKNNANADELDMIARNLRTRVASNLQARLERQSN